MSRRRVLDVVVYDVDGHLETDIGEQAAGASELITLLLTAQLRIAHDLATLWEAHDRLFSHDQPNRH